MFINWESAPESLNVKQACILINRGERFVRKEINRKGSGFPFFRVGRIIRIPKAALKQWFDENTQYA
jgi:excisionase family DNA binding protein